VADRGRVGERYILGAHNVWLDEFLQVLAAETGLPAPQRRVPLALLSVAGLFGELAGSDRVCWESTAHGRRRQWFDCRKAREELGWSPVVPLETSVHNTVAWCRQELSAPQPHSEANAVAR
jgi:dihydroflavonol-4-reductase